MGQTVMMHYELWANEGVTSSLYDYDKKEYVDDIFYSTYDEKNPFRNKKKMAKKSTCWNYTWRPIY